MYPTIVIPSMNPTLCQKARAFLPNEWPVIVKDGNPFTHFDELRTLPIQTKWAINLDEDCFVINPPGVINLIELMEEQGYDTAGIQDGSSYIRHHNPVLFNPFFFVFDVQKVQSAPKRTENVSTESQLFSHLVRFHDLPQKYDSFEPYYPFFLDLLHAELRPLFLKNHAFEEFEAIAGLGKPTILLDETEQELAIHAWYSRLYEHPIVQTRISICEDYALSARNRLIGCQ